MFIREVLTYLFCFYPLLSSLVKRRGKIRSYRTDRARPILKRNSIESCRVYAKRVSIWFFKGTADAEIEVSAERQGLLKVSFLTPGFLTAAFPVH